MTRRERKLLRQTAVLGVALTAAVVLTQHWGLLAPLENWLYDRRIQDCQFFNPPPTDKLVHLDIDDASLETIGRWPWHRSRLAQILDELKATGVKSVALDIIMPEPQEVELVENPRTGELRRVDHDAIFADAVQRFGSVLVPISFETILPRTTSYRWMYDALIQDLELTPEQVVQIIRAHGFEGDDLTGQDRDRFLWARAEAMRNRVHDLLGPEPDLSFEALRDRLLPRTDPRYTGSPLLRLLAKQHAHVTSVMALRRRLPRTLLASARVLPVVSQSPPVPQFSRAAGGTGFVYYDPDADGVVRTVVLGVDHQGFIFPQLGLALALDYLDADIGQVSFDRRNLLIPLPSRAGNAAGIVLPVHRRYYPGLHESYDLEFSVPWFGEKNHWETMYDPAHRQIVQHLSLTAVWQVVELRQRIADNNASADDAIKFFYAISDPAALERYERATPPLDDPEIRLAVIDPLLADDFFRESVAVYEQDQAAGTPLDEVGQKFVAAYHALQTLREENGVLREQLAQQQSMLKTALEGKAALIGWTATAAIADFVPTSLHAKCPGVVIHGAVFNAVLTGETWRRAPDWATPAITILMGLLTVAVLCLLTPGQAAFSAMFLLVSYFLFNGLLVFDYGNTILGIAGPLTAVLLVWSGCTLFRFVIERRERARIKKRFESYVDPALVNYVIEHPEHARLDGERRELTVVFTDLAGFTTLSEKLQERTVPILNEYMGLMVPIIRQRKGYVNKFLGDGIMFFFGAPLANELHAGDAIATALTMQQMLVEFNAKLTQQDLPNVKMRVGIASGPMVVGDAGSADASDYTVLGDNVNLAARLESANKATDTLILINERTAELVKDMFLLRPVARLQVVGKTQGVMTYEPLCFTEHATAEQRRMVELFSAVVESFVVQKFDQCLAALDLYEKDFDETKLTRAYRNLAVQYQGLPPGEDFAGQIVLESK